MECSPPGMVLEFLGRVAYEATLIQPLLPTYLHLLLSAIFPIYTAAHASLAKPKSAAPPDKTDDDSSTTTNSETIHKLEGLTPSDAIAFPLLAGAVLSSLYFLLKWLQDPEILNRILGVYFSCMGLVMATKFLGDALTVLRSFCFPVQYSRQYSERGFIMKPIPHKRYHRACHPYSSKPIVLREDSPLPGIFGKIPLPDNLSKLIWDVRQAVYAKADLHVHVHKLLTIKGLVGTLDVISIVLTTLVVGYNTFISSPWYLTNFLGFSFCYTSLQLMTPTTAWTGTLVLAALFIYDIFFVFYTPVMVTVATKLDVPIKLLFPRPDGCVLPVGAIEGSAAMEAYKHCLAKKRTMAMLGLGDIVLPGMMMAFALRFDLYLYYLRKGNPVTIEQKAKYMQATGGWGERFWTSKNLRSPALNAKTFPKTYFNATVAGYILGMITTLVAMQVSQHAQPALLYLVPGVLISLYGTAVMKGDLKLLWSYSEDEEEAKETDKDKDKKASEEKKNEKADSPTSAGSEKNCTQLLLFSLSKPQPLKAINPPTKTNEEATISSETSFEREKAKNNGDESGSTLSTSAAPTPASSDDDEAVLPDVAADRAVLAKLRKEVSASSAGVVDEQGKPPEKRRRTGDD